MQGFGRSGDGSEAVPTPKAVGRAGQTAGRPAKSPVGRRADTLRNGQAELTTEELRREQRDGGAARRSGIGITPMRSDAAPSRELGYLERMLAADVATGFDAELSTRLIAVTCRSAATPPLSDLVDPGFPAR